MPSAAILRRRSWNGLPLGLTLALMLATASALASPDASPPPAAPLSDVPAGAPAARPHASDVLRYKVVIVAPSGLKPLLERAVDLVRWQSYEDMTEQVFDLLAREALDQAREAAAADGYFSASAAIAVDRATDPATVTLTIDTGTPTRVADVRVVVVGPAATDVPAGTDAIAKAQDEWLLPEGDTFRQAQWSAAKAKAVATIAESRYAAAKLTNSEALVDPDAYTADLHVEIDSGPAFRFGSLEIQGLSKYDIALVRNFSSIREGDPYSALELEQFVRRLNASGYFASVHASIDPDPAHADNAPVRVSVIEGPTKKLEVGLGYSTDTAFRGNLNYSDVNVDDHGLQMYVDARFEQKVQSASLRFVSRPDDRGWLTTYNALAQRTDIENLVTQTAAAGVRRQTVDERDRWSYGAAYLIDRQLPQGAEETNAHALFVDVTRTWRRTDDLIAPTRGYNVNAQLGAGIPGVSSRTFGRAIVQFAAWHPLGRVTELSMRAELGAVIATEREGIPSSLLFRTGGDTTVRGYAYESLGVKNGDAVVPGRYVAVASIEATRWIGVNWGLAAFVDAGNAVDEVSDLKHLALGYGVGLRLRTPIGPFRLDVAYGQDTGKVRLHFSVGLSF